MATYLLDTSVIIDALNDKRGRGALIKWLAETPATRVVFEPTGPSHRAIERAFSAPGVPFVKVNPRLARRLAEATGKLVKADCLDAAILTRMDALLEFQARPAQARSTSSNCRPW